MLKGSLIGGFLGLAALLAQPSTGAVLTKQGALDKAWGDELLITTENMVPSWIAQTHRFIYSEALGKSWTLLDFDVDTGRSMALGAGRDASVSPDGHHVLFLAPDDAKKGNALWMMNVDGTNRHPVDTGAKVDPAGGQLGAWASYHWAPDSRHFFLMHLTLNQLANVKASGAVSTAHVYPADMSQDTRLVSDIAVFTGDGNLVRKWTVNLAVPDVQWLGNDALMYSHTDGRPVSVAKAAVYRFDIHTGQEDKLISGYGRQVTYRPAASPDGQHIAFIADPGEPVFTPGRRELAVFDVATHAVRLLTDNAAVQNPEWSNDGKTLYFTDSLSTRRQLKAVLADGKTMVLNEELGQTLGASESGDDKWIAWTVHKPFEEFVINVAPRTLDGTLHATRTLPIRPASFGPEYGTTVGMTWSSPDGTRVDGLLTMPPDYNPKRKYPMIVQVHGGPQGGVEMTDYGWPGDGYFDALLATHGYLVFRPDYRSSGELGWGPYIKAKNAGQIFAANRADIESGVQKLIDEGRVDPKHIIMIGLSYGGFTTDYIATHSKMFRAAITYEGGDYLIDWGGRPEWPEHNVSIEWEMGGTPFDRMSVYMDNSVVPALQTATTPMMLVNGEHGINSASSPLIYNSLHLRGIDAQFIYYDAEGHGIEQHVNQVDFLDRIMAWIEKYAPTKA